MSGALAGYLSRGWHPAPWAHHPKEIRDALRSTGIRPGVKLCQTNSQRFMLFAEHLRARLEYREGIAAGAGGISFEHAWLLFDGAVLDLTVHSRNLQYLASYAVPMSEIIDAMLETDTFDFVRPEQIRDLRIACVQERLSVN